MALDALRAMISARGSLSEMGKRRLKRIEKVFDAASDEPQKVGAVHARSTQDPHQQRPHV